MKIFFVRWFLRFWVLCLASTLQAEHLCGKISLGLFALADGFGGGNVLSYEPNNTWAAYAKLWGYELTLVDRARMGQPEAIAGLLRKDCDYLVWLGEYVLPLDGVVPVECLIQQMGDDVDIIITSSFASPVIQAAGAQEVLIIKNNQKNKDLFQRLYTLKNSHPDAVFEQFLSDSLLYQTSPMVAYLKDWYKRFCNFFTNDQAFTVGTLGFPVVKEYKLPPKKQKKTRMASKDYNYGPIALVTLSTVDRLPFSKFTTTSLKQYADRWGYDLFIYQESLDAARHPAWSKIKAVKNILNSKKYSFVVWVDDDIFITNPEKSIESFIELAGAKAEFIISAHMERPVVPQDINTGLFIVKNSPWVLTLLDRIWDIGNHRYANSGAWDQDALVELVSRPEFCNDARIVRFPGRIIQSLLTLLKTGCRGDYGQWQPGDFAAHMAGATMNGRILTLRQLAYNYNVYPSLPGQLKKSFLIKQEKPISWSDTGWFISNNSQQN